MSFIHHSFLRVLRPQLPDDLCRGPADAAGLGVEKIFLIISPFIEHSSIAFKIKDPS